MGAFQYLFKNRSLFYKFSLLAIVPVFCVVTIFTLYTIRSLEKTLIARAEARALTLTGLSAFFIADGLAFYNKGLLNNLVDRLAAKTNIQAAMIVDTADGRILAHSDHQKDGELFIKDFQKKRPASSIFGSVPEIYNKTGSKITISAPVIITGRQFGTILVDFLLADVYRQIISFRRTIITIAAITALFGIIFSLVMARIISSPLKGLARQAQRIGSGDFDSRISYVSKDAIGRLAASFNRMADDLHTNIRLLKENQTKYQTLFNDSNDAVFIIQDEEHGEKIVECNQQAHFIFKGSKEEIVGRPLSEFCPPVQSGGALSQDTLSPRIKAALKNGRENFTCRLIRFDGQDFDAEVSFTRTRIRDRLMVQAVIRDISQQVQAQAQIKALNRDLEKRVADRTAELEKAQQAMLNLVEDLNVARDAAEAANKAKSFFLANMSHEIRTPMNAIIGLTHLALKTELSPKQQDYLKKIDFSAKSLLGIINDILDFSKIEAHKIDIEAVEFLLDDVLANLTNLIAVKTKQKDLEVLFDIQPDIPAALIGDPLRLGQILINLVGNAIKFTPQGQIIVSAKTLSKTDAETVIQFSVSDTGIGMTEEQTARLFQAFSQADASTSRKYGGTGLGLAISKRLAELMGGSIQVKSKYQQGTTFTFSVKFGLPADQKKRHERLAEDLANLRVLIVDGNRTSQTIMKNYCQAMDLKPLVTGSGRHALDLISAAPANRPFGMMILDGRIKNGLDGISTARQIRNLSGPKGKIPIIMTTAHGHEDIISEAESLNINAFLQKPVSQSTLLDTIMTVLGITQYPYYAPRTQSEIKPQNLQPIQGARILVAEDNEINQQVARELLEGAGFVITMVDNGREALAAAQKNGYDLILMDIQLPVMDGFEATRAIRKLGGKMKTLPIIAMTAHAMAGDREKSLDAGLNDHVTKPIDPDRLFAALIKWIKPRKERTLHPAKSKPWPSPKVVTGQNEIDWDLPGIAVATGLKRVAGNQELYRKLLKKFQASHAQVASEIKSAINDTDLATATHLAHTIKGVAGNLGADQLSKAAAAIESALKQENAENAVAQLHNLEFCLNEVLAGIAAFLGPQPESAKKPVPKAIFNKKPDIAAVRPLLEEMPELLESDLIRAQEHIKRLRGMLEASPLMPQFIELEKHLEAFDTDSALASLENISQALEIAQKESS